MAVVRRLAGPARPELPGEGEEGVLIADMALNWRTKALMLCTLCRTERWVWSMLRQTKGLMLYALW
ncbi:hypothetical protein [Nonomuraea sp. NPDC003804]|uniref:hypothetical protein n=1 Tax=Nonomuraea sp. NPDC003804 TaxID=3154547 RepID=UPI0033AC12E7